MRVAVISGLAAAALAASAAHAADARDCAPMSGDILTYRLAEVESPRAPYQNPPGGCSGAYGTCTPKVGYLVRGDLVMAGAAFGPFVCTAYVSPSRPGHANAGWLRRSDLRIEPPQAGPALAAWLGRWRSGAAGIRIRPGAAGRLLVDGQATWGADDPELVRRGGVNIGAIQSDIAPTGDVLAFGDGAPDDPRRQRVMVDDGGLGRVGLLPYVRDGQGQDCYVRMRLSGPYLTAVDNRNCGGANVTFSGFYRKAP